MKSKLGTVRPWFFLWKLQKFHKQKLHCFHVNVMISRVAASFTFPFDWGNVGQAEIGKLQLQY